MITCKVLTQTLSAGFAVRQVDETRPRNQGALTAWELAAGIDVIGCCHHFTIGFFGIFGFFDMLVIGFFDWLFVHDVFSHYCYLLIFSFLVIWNFIVE